MSSDATGARLRIGDAERDAAVSSLGEHFAAGRLTREEFDERLERAWAAKTTEEVDPLFVDLPPANDHRAAVRAGRGAPIGFTARPDRSVGRPRRGLPPPLVFLVLVALVIAVINSLPFILIALGVLWLLGAFGNCGRSRSRSWAQTR